MPGYTARVLAHEIGHQMGLDHLNTGLNLMTDYGSDLREMSNDQARFDPVHLDILRRRTQTPQTPGE